MLVDEVINTCQVILRDEAKLISYVAAIRKRVEAWLQIEIFRRLAVDLSGTALQLERAYPGRLERCDLWCQENDGSESWVELKVCVTNYARSFGYPTPSRPITYQISDLNRDIEKLRRIPPVKNNCDVVWLAYPMPTDFRTHTKWAEQLRNLDAGARVSESFVASVTWGSSSASVVGYRLQVS